MKFWAAVTQVSSVPIGDRADGECRNAPRTRRHGKFPPGISNMPHLRGFGTPFDW